MRLCLLSSRHEIQGLQCIGHRLRSKNMRICAYHLILQPLCRQHLVQRSWQVPLVPYVKPLLLRLRQVPNVTRGPSKIRDGWYPADLMAATRKPMESCPNTPFVMSSYLGGTRMQLGVLNLPQSNSGRFSVQGGQNTDLF